MKLPNNTDNSAKDDIIPESLLALSLYDPPKYGWSVLGGIIDVMPPHEKARQQIAKEEYLLQKKKKEKGLSPTEAATAEKKDDGTSSSMDVDDSDGAAKTSIAETTNKDDTQKNNGESNETKSGSNENEPKDEKTKNSSDEKTKENVKIIKISPAINPDNNQLNIHHYHRGIEGQEIRSPDTGELLCDVEQTDTNHYWTTPNLVAEVMISFPLGDIEDDYAEKEDENKRIKDAEEKAQSKEITKGSTNNSSGRSSRTTRRRLFHSESSSSNQNSSTAVNKEKSKKEEEVPYFRQTIQWDLSSPSTPTPSLFAAQIATEYGLSFPQTLDLATSIQTQLDTFVKTNVNYNPPVTHKDPLGKVRDTSTLSNTPNISLADLSAENKKSSQQAKSDRSVRSVRGGGCIRGSSTNARAELTPAHLLPQHGGILPQHKTSRGRVSAPFEFSVEMDYVKEVQRRARAECKALFESRGDKGCDVTYNSGTVCHICHARKAHLAIFPCGNTTHGFCEFHCSTRMGFHAIDIKVKSIKLDYCPICCLTCVCPKCARRLDTVSIDFKQACLDQGKDISEIQETNMEVLPLCGGLGKKASGARSRGGGSAGGGGATAASAGGAICSVISGSTRKGRRTKHGDDENDKESETKDAIDKSLSPTTRSARIHERNTRRSKPLLEDEAQQSLQPRQTLITTPHAKVQRRQQPVKLEIKKVKQIPPRELPREMCGGTDLDPAEQNDYRTVYKHDGESFVREDICDIPNQDFDTDDSEKQTRAPKRAASTGSSNDDEDGNVNYCNICEKSGDLVCCDKCPRAFHPKCMSIDVSSLPDKYWECPGCKADQSIQDDDKTVKGEESMNKTVVNLVHYDYCPSFTAKVTVLSMLHEMILRLIKFDFGDIFSVPVDTRSCRDYLSVVKSPMDYGTISEKLINGQYLREIKLDKESSKDANKDKDGDDDGVTSDKKARQQLISNALDDAACAVLKDLELVWHNCYTYNEEGSAIYRMASVQRRKSEKIRSCCIDELLPDDVKKRVKEYADECEQKRTKKTSKDTQASSSEAAAALNTQQTKRVPNEIVVPLSRSGTSRVVAVFNPKTNMVLKLYTTISAAITACMFLSDKLGYEGEFPITSHNMKQTIRMSSIDPSKTIFGFRWLFLQDLKDGRVTFAKAKEEIPTVDPSSLLEPEKEFTLVERIHEDSRELHASIYEAFQAIAVDEPSEQVTLQQFREKLQAAPLGEVVEHIGCRWRILQRGKDRAKSPSTAEVENKPSDSEAASLHPAQPTRIISLGGDGYFTEDGLETSLPSNILIYKEDILSGARLGGFETLEAAYQDWLNTCKAAIVTPLNTGDMDFFRVKYINGYCTVDGIQWKPVPPLESRFEVEPEKDKVNESASKEASRGVEASASTEKINQSDKNVISESKCHDAGSEVVLEGDKVSPNRASVDGLASGDAESQGVPDANKMQIENANIDDPPSVDQEGKSNVDEIQSETIPTVDDVSVEKSLDALKEEKGGEIPMSGVTAEGTNETTKESIAEQESHSLAAAEQTAKSSPPDDKLSSQEPSVENLQGEEPGTNIQSDDENKTKPDGTDKADKFITSVDEKKSMSIVNEEKEDENKLHEAILPASSGTNEDKANSSNMGKEPHGDKRPHDDVASNDDMESPRKSRRLEPLVKR